MSWLNKLYPTGKMPVCKIKGEAHRVFNFIHMLASSVPAETDPEWWEVRLIILFDIKNWRN